MATMDPDRLDSAELARIKVELEEAEARLDRDRAGLRELRARADGLSLGQFRARGWTAAAIVALFGGLAAFIPYYSGLVLMATAAATAATLAAWLVISLRPRHYSPPLSVHLGALSYIYAAVAVESISVGANGPGSGVGALLLALTCVTFVVAAVMGWLRPGHRVHDGPAYAVALTGGLWLATFLKLLPRDFVLRYVFAVMGLVLVAAVAYSWLTFVKRWRTGEAQR